MFAFLTLALAGVGTMMQARQGRKALAAQREANEVSYASEDFRNRLERRRLAKRSRIQRARVAAASQASGVSGSSGQMGAEAAIEGSASNSIAYQKANILAIAGINEQNQKSAAALSKAKRIGAMTDLALDSLSLANDEGLFD